VEVLAAVARAADMHARSLQPSGRPVDVCDQDAEFGGELAGEVARLAEVRARLG
jgi:hypothetical protein